ncbi:UDP-N-acetylmuramate dehydrogenase [Colwellia sp. E2M01]|uniref:UDP-N-acetylmuramate dehydrogenase n=1 Tax=Colwellia sp. E2M01 TaxID=2841561 RepID=UPI001C08A7EA|nr:UDP-N-acetylmuramate dehydrogenase [Colwellia sp. E2M01]MBU2871020.1 UDP-N-acetylmuramate dehydrogenase [Colwellia sp. E2M01]
MQSIQNYALQSNNSFNIKTSCSHIYFPSNLAELQQLPDLTVEPFYILGEGSNTLFVEESAPIIIQPKFHGITVEEQAEYYLVTVGAAENWHELVCFCLTKGINGLENLALIPGSVGAAPVQNIGAYGVEFADFCEEVQWFEFASKTLHALTKKDCDFAYRDSIFKQSHYNKGLITQVTFKFPKAWQPNLSYAGLDTLSVASTATEVMNQVIALRSSKLPDPKVLANAGSFFKNPVVSVEEFITIQAKFENIPHYPQANGEIKLAAGWLIDQAGLKGFRHDNVGVHQQQALVLVNYGSDFGADIISLAKYVQRVVVEKFSVTLIPEVRMISHLGEQAFTALNDTHPIGKLSHD